MKFLRAAIVATTLSTLSLQQSAQPAERVAESNMQTKPVTKSLSQAGLRQDSYFRATIADVSKMSREEFVPKNVQD